MHKQIPPPPLVRSLVSGLFGNSEPTPPQQTAVATTNVKRYKLWDLDDKHHCPIVGTCFDVDDLVRLARRFAFSAPLTDEFALHVEAVGHTRSRNSVAETMQRQLDRKYSTYVDHIARAKTSAEVLAYWKERLARGEIAGPLWACYTHKAGDVALHHTLYGDIHMLSHQIGAGQAADVRRLGHLERENAQLQKQQTQLEQELLKTNRLLSEERRQREYEAIERSSLRESLEATRKRLAEFESGQVHIEMGQRLLALQDANDRLMTAAQRVWELDKTVKAAHEEAARIAQERDAALTERESLEQLFVALETPEEEECTTPCASAGCNECGLALSSRCILYVGGRASMIGHYRRLADRLGIRFIHHDGGVEESLSRLPELIHGADAVVCPTDHIGHSAYYQIKSQCKRVGKPCLFYKGSGVSSFAVAINKVSRGDFSVAAANTPS
jgi:hypothetical protein